MINIMLSHLHFKIRKDHKMKKINLISYIVLLFALIAYTAEISPKGLKKKGKNVYKIDMADTVLIAQGATFNLYDDTSDSTAINEGNYKGDSIIVSITGYGDADTTQAQLTFSIATDNKHYATYTIDTLNLNGAGLFTEYYTLPKITGSNLKVLFTGYGTTDTCKITNGILYGK